ncbi:MAG: DNA/RNA nuclease SfsA [Bacteroidales bacterium]|nr:DNA/RNA nuclease SfsA [Bacteroidales bacterium]
MIIFENLIKGRLIKRYKRFLADVELENGEIITAHCTNTGSMKSCIEEGAPVLLSPANDPKRKTKYTWEMIWINKSWVGVNTNHANTMAFELIKNNHIPSLVGLTSLKREVRFQDSRFDIFGMDGQQEIWIEVKNVSMKEGDWALFPDSPTTRGQKHLKTLITAKEAGHRAAMIYIIQRTDIKYFAAAKEIDPKYAQLLELAKEKGVEVYAIQVKLSKSGMKLFQLL